MATVRPPPSRHQNAAQRREPAGAGARAPAPRAEKIAQLAAIAQASAALEKQRELIGVAHARTGPLQRRASAAGGLPAPLKNGIEQLSGMAMDHVKVHYNSSKPAQLSAHAYAQGSDIHLAPGQERHLPHEAWHVVQQAQGRVQPTRQMKAVALNDCSELEHEADVMGGRAQAVGQRAAKSGPAPAPVTQARLSGPAIVQRFPRHHEIVTANGIISAYDLLQILQHVAHGEIASIHLRPTSDWFRQFQGLGDPVGNYANPAESPGYSYGLGGVSHRFTVGGIAMSRIGTSNYMHAHGNAAGHDYTSYPRLFAGLAALGGGAPEVLRAQRMRAMLSAGTHMAAGPGAAPAGPVVPGQNVHEAVATTALFGAETARSPRTFLSHMMMLDRLEAQQVYGAAGIKTLTLPKMLNGEKLGAESNNVYWNRKRGLLNARAPGHGANLTGPGGLVSVVHQGGPAPHGGKAAMAAAGTRAFGMAPLPLGGALNLVHAKEVNTLIKWLNLQLGAGALAGMSRAAAIATITGLVQIRARNYYLMTQAENHQRWVQSILMRNALAGWLRPHAPAMPVLRMPLGLYLRQVLIPALHQLPVGGGGAPQMAMVLHQGGVGRPGAVGPGGMRPLGAVAPNALMIHPGGALVRAGAGNVGMRIALAQFEQLAGHQFHLQPGQSMGDFLRSQFGEVRRVWKRAALRMHPDHQGADPTDSFQQLQSLFDMLRQFSEQRPPARGAVRQIEAGAQHARGLGVPHGVVPMGWLEGGAGAAHGGRFDEASAHLASIAGLAGAPVPFVLDQNAPLGAQLRAHWPAIKKLYYNAALRHHPDKGGDEEVFKGLGKAFSALTAMKDEGADGAHAEAGAPGAELEHPLQLE